MLLVVRHVCVPGTMLNIPLCTTQQVIFAAHEAVQHPQCVEEGQMQRAQLTPPSIHTDGAGLRLRSLSKSLLTLSPSASCMYGLYCR